MGRTAADVYLEGEQDLLTAQLSQEWAQNVRDHWRQRHAETKDLAAVIEESPDVGLTAAPTTEVFVEESPSPCQT